jgi:hypothetical protein
MITRPASGQSRPRAYARRLGLDGFDVCMLVTLAGVSVAVLLPLALQGRTLSGADGVLAPDQFQYFAWIREAAHHGLIGNRFDLAPGPRPFLHPGFGLSGLVHALTGLSIPLTYLLWKPVAVGVTFVGCLLYVRRLLPSSGQRRVALVLALFSVMPAAAVVWWTNWGGNRQRYTFNFISGEMWTGQYLWGYLMTAIAVFLMPLVLLGIESWRLHGKRRTLWLAAAGTLVVCWLQPWQGAVLVLIVMGVEALRFARTGKRPPVALSSIAVAGAVPAAYYYVLSVADPSWRLASESNAAGALTIWTWPWWAIVLTMFPLALPALLAYRLPAPTWQEQAVRAWPPAVLVVYLLPVGTFPFHAVQGLALPLAILAVQGVASVYPRPRIALVTAAVAVLTVPGFAHKLEVARNNVRAPLYPYYVTQDERRAFEALGRDRRPGGVLAPEYSSNLVPSRTGREAYVGGVSWSPNWFWRLRTANALFQGRLGDRQARAFVIGSHARFLLSDCRPSVDLAPQLRPMLARVRHFGCATIYELRVGPNMLRVGSPDA